MITITDDIILEDYFDKRTIKPLKRETLIKKLKLLELKYCPSCGNRLKFINTKGKTNKYCSRKCAGKITMQKCREIVKNKYGVDNISQLPETQNKIRKNNLKKYGVEYTAQLPEVKEKIKQTNLKKYGCINPANNKDIMDKRKEHNLKKYGAEYPFTLKKYKDKSTKTIVKKFLDKYNYYNIEYKNGAYYYNCNICGEITKYSTKNDINNFIQRVRLGFLPCRKCLSNNGVLQRSSVEILLEEELKKNGIKTEHQKELDIFLPEYNLGIEVNGIYWHSEKFKDKNYHSNKLKKFANKGIQILSFSDYEISNNIQKVVKYILGKIGNLPSIGASKCKIREIDTSTAREFCEAVHIHGYAGGFKKYGLFYKEELVSVCVVGKDRFSKGNNELEIIRLANSRKILGGFGRFLKRILLDFPEYNQINTFIDAFLGLPNNNIFTRYGFKYEGWTQPNYKWVVGNKVLNRQSTQKHKLLEKGYKGKTENDIMIRLGGYKIFDAGNYKFKFIIKQKD